MRLRKYQVEAIDAAYHYLRTRDGNPCIVIPTGGGKTPVIAQICRDAVRWEGRVLILAHVRELLEQAVDKIRMVDPTLEVGVYSAGLNSRDTDAPIIVGGIQSVYRNVEGLGRFDLILIDEAHRIPIEGDGMYLSTIAKFREINSDLRIIGLTATPYRMKEGMICGPDAILTDVCYEVGVKELIVAGYLSPLRSKTTKDQQDFSSLHVRAGEYIASEVEAIMSPDAVVASACVELCHYAYQMTRRSVLIFASGVDHGRTITSTLQAHGQQVGEIYGSTPSDERDDTIARFRAGDLRYLVNVEVLTLGFDAPNVDMVALMRPTLSPGLYYQMIGRGFRVHEGKDFCLVMDYGGNVMRHGPVDAIKIRDRNRNTGNDDRNESPPCKACPECQELIAAGFRECPECGYQFPPDRPKHAARASADAVLSGERWDETYTVEDTDYRAHTKRGADEDHPKTLCVSYRIGLGDWIQEYVCVEHQGYAREKAMRWWDLNRVDSIVPYPINAQDAADMGDAGDLRKVKEVTVREGGEFREIIGKVFVEEEVESLEEIPF